MPHEILFTETYGNEEDIFAYIKPPDQNSIVRINSNIDLKRSKLTGIGNLIKEIILPQGYPESVSRDYSSYQIWDTVQAFCSTISNTLSTQAVLQGIGVGTETASATSAAITWVLKDGTGMVARIVFAWLSGSGLDAECKKWRLFADILNDIAMCIELTILPFVPQYSLQILCISTSFKALVGVAGGATRAAITQHQAVVGNTGDVSAKDGSQETCVNLLASFLGVFILSILGQSNVLWYLFATMTVIHLYANYKAVKCLEFETLNTERFVIVLKEYLTTGKIPNPVEVNKKESVLLGSGYTDKSFCGFKIKLGCSLRDLTKDCLMTAQEFKLMSNLFKSRNYMILSSVKKQTIYIVFDKKHTSEDVFLAYFHAFILGITASFIFNFALDTAGSEQVFEKSILPRLKFLAHLYEDTHPPSKLQIDVVISVDQLVGIEQMTFLNSISKSGWNMTSHYLRVDKWRGNWMESHKE